MARGPYLIAPTLSASSTCPRPTMCTSRATPVCERNEKRRSDYTGNVWLSAPPEGQSRRIDGIFPFSHCHRHHSCKLDFHSLVIPSSPIIPTQRNESWVRRRRRQKKTAISPLIGVTGIKGRSDGYRMKWTDKGRQLQGDSTAISSSMHLYVAGSSKIGENVGQLLPSFDRLNLNISAGYTMGVRK